MTWGSSAEDASVGLIVEMAKIDWVDVDVLGVEVVRRVGRDASASEFAERLGELVGVLIDHGVVPGELGVDPSFRPWAGTRAERVTRIRRETLALDRRPRPNDIAWFSYEPN